MFAEQHYDNERAFTCANMLRVYDDVYAEFCANTCERSCANNADSVLHDNERCALYDNALVQSDALHDALRAVASSALVLVASSYDDKLAQRALVALFDALLPRNVREQYTNDKYALSYNVARNVASDALRYARSVVRASEQ